jgi:hypothetical protein
MKPGIMQEDRLTEEHKAKWSLWDYARAHKIYCDSRGERFKGNISVALNAWAEAAKSVLLPATSSP